MELAIDIDQDVVDQSSIASTPSRSRCAKQFHGTLPKTVKAELLQLALYAKFQQEWMGFLDQLGALLAKADADG